MTTTEYPRLKSYLEDLDTLTAEGPDDTEFEFEGAWIIDPTEDLRSGEPGQDAGGVWAVAVTARGRFAVHAAHCNGAWSRLTDHDTLDEALADVPADIAAELRARVTGVRRLNI